MLLARGTARRREVGVRAARGASRAQLVAQLLTESLLLASLGGIAGVAFAVVSVRVLVAGIPNRLLQGMPYLRNLHVDRGVLAFAFACSLATALLCGIAPAMRAAKASLSAELGSGGRTIAGAGLLARSAKRLLDVDPGFRSDRILTVRVTATDSKYQDAATRGVFFDRLAEGTRALPGVRGVAFVDRLPMLGSGNTGSPSIVGREPAGADDPSAELRTVSREYFEVMGIPRVSGRTFSLDDRTETQPVVVVNRALAERIFPGENAVGQAITFAFSADHPPFQIVGVVGDENLVALDSLPRPSSTLR
ncbi:MAG: ABC transporter permease [Acidobacteriota bacterium]